MQLTWKDIAVVPTANDFLDIILNRTQRKTPTVIRAGFKIQRIRAFYMRKVRYTCDGFCEKLQDIVDSFPRIDNIHPFHRDLLDTLYEKNHYKMSLASLSRAKTLIEQVQRDYERLLKFGQSLFQCKQLKRAALGRMATIIKKLKDPLLYLEQVRQHLSRLPSIDPNTRTLLICGYPNVGKSSFLRRITRADVEVQPYAFTTKSLYVGHFDYKYLRFQAIDTPGILDRPTEEMNNIEMQSIYAIAHIRSCVLYFMDLSEQCGFSVADQVKLFHSIKPLFANKTVMVVINKIDLVRPSDLDPERAALLDTLRQDNVEICELSCTTEENIMEIRNRACERLLTARIEQKMSSAVRISNLLNKINVARPTPRDDKARTPFRPVNADRPRDEEKPLSRDIEAEQGGAGVYQPDYHEAYLLDHEEWKSDIIPEILDGKNVYDFIDPDIGDKLKALEEEEENLEKQGFYESEEEMVDSEIEELRAKAAWIRQHHKKVMNAAILKRNSSKKTLVPRKHQNRTIKDMEKHFGDIGLDISAVTKKARKRVAVEEPSSADVVVASMGGLKTGATALNSEQGKRKAVRSLGSAELFEKLRKRRRAVQLMLSQQGRADEADRTIPSWKPKHLFAGKRGIGKTQRR